MAGNAIQWTPPLENDDGSFVSDLAGYTIVYGPSSTVLHNSVRVENPSLSSYVLESLPKGTYYVAVKAVNSDGTESATSNVVKMVL